MREEELADRGVEREAVNPVARRIDEHVGRAVDHVAGGHDIAAWLKTIDERTWTVARSDSAMHGKDRPNRRVDIDIARAIERIELKDVLALGVLRRDGDRLFHLFAAEHADMTALLNAIDDRVVGEDVELLNFFSLNVHFAGEAENVHEAGLAHLRADDLRCERDLMEKPSEISRCILRLSLTGKQMLFESLAVVGGRGGADREKVGSHGAVLAGIAGRYNRATKGHGDNPRFY